ncbi:hypothetical protein L596_013648 [Steinernema carpocapsae]|uniref:Uncharacterized protein n=1 Tax=Steinernema carpocapsae TaxID=34508 RepID=A0A4V6XWG6_STECR|nr:hypothetical protein L596_013648 [Steinernema carpocapsae]
MCTFSRLTLCKPEINAKNNKVRIKARIMQISGVRSKTEKRLLYSITLQAILPIFFIVPFLVRSQLVSFNVAVSVPKAFIDFVRVLTYSYYAFNSLIVIVTVKPFRQAIFRSLRCQKLGEHDSTRLFVSKGTARQQGGTQNGTR